MHKSSNPVNFGLIILCIIIKSMGCIELTCKESENMVHKKFLIIITLILFAAAAICGILSYKGGIGNRINPENSNSEEKNINKKNNQNSLKDRTFTGKNLKYNNQSVPVLYYHSIEYEKGNELRLPKEKFREQMKFLKENGYTTLTMNELYDFLAHDKPVPDKSVVITFDDGYRDNYENAFPILKEFGFKATIFIITSTIDKEEDFLTSNQLKEMERYGIDIESHTVNHDKLDRLSYDKQLYTLKNSKEFLEKLLNRKIYYFAYPYGEWNENTIKALKNAGYKMAFTTESGWANKNKGLYRLNRVYVNANHSMAEFERRLANEKYDISE